LTEDKTKVHEAMTDDRVRDHRNHHESEQRAISTELRCSSDEWNQQVCGSCANGSRENSEEEVSNLKPLKP